MIRLGGFGRRIHFLQRPHRSVSYFSNERFEELRLLTSQHGILSESLRDELWEHLIDPNELKIANTAELPSKFSKNGENHFIRF